MQRHRRFAERARFFERVDDGADGVGRRQACALEIARPAAVGVGSKDDELSRTDDVRPARGPRARIVKADDLHRVQF